MDYSGNAGQDKGIYDGTVPGVEGTGTDGVLLSSSRQGYGSKKRDNMEKDVDEGWIVDFGKELDDTIAHDDSDDEFHPEVGYESNEYGTTASIISRKSRLIDELYEDNNNNNNNNNNKGNNKRLHGVTQSTVNTNVLSKGVTSMNDVMMVANSPAHSPYMISGGLSKSAPSSPSSPFYPSTMKTPSLRDIVSSPLSSSSSSPIPKLSSPLYPSIKLGSPLSACGNSPFTPGSLSISGESASEREYLRNKRKREREKKMNAGTEDERRRKKRMLLQETPHNISQLELVTKELIADLLWDNKTRTAINTYRFNQKKEEADKRVEDHVIQSHSFKIIIEPKDTGVIRKPKRRGAATHKITQRCPLFPSMSHMDFIYWTTLAEVEPIKLVQKDSRREFYYTLICRRLWRFISYYGKPEEEIPFVPFVHFVPGVLYMLAKDGLLVEGEQWIKPDEYLKENLPTMKELAWRPKRKKLDGDLLANEVIKKGNTKRQILIKGTGVKPKKKKKMSNWFGDANNNRQYGNNDNDDNEKEEDDDDDDDDEEDEIKTLHQHKHGIREDTSVGSLALFFRKRKRGKRSPKFKRVEEPPRWRPLGSLQSNKEVDDETAMKHILSFGNKGRLYNNAIISQGKRYIKENIMAFGKDPIAVEGLRECLKQVLEFY